jgi:cytochrome c-type biogenesis protein CcmH/NrfF
VTCGRWRQEIANLLGQGYSDDQIFTYFAERYGDDVTGIPLNGEQRNLALLFPIILTLVAGILIVWQVRRLKMQEETRALQAARVAGLREDYDRPVPDNVDPTYLQRFLNLLEEK